jgi:hypothetical protein
MSHQTENVIDLLAEKVATYLRSVEHADTELASTLWATSPEVSFIHPRGHERGWEQVAQNFYQQTMGDTTVGRTRGGEVGSPRAARAHAEYRMIGLMTRPASLSAIA